MVFHCRCFSFTFEEEDVEIDTSSLEEDDAIENDKKTQTKSTSDQTFYTASSDFNRPVFSNWTEQPNSLRVFTVAELKAATNNFCRASKIGEDRFGRVYRGVIKSLVHPFNEIDVTVKYGPLQRLKEWVMALNFLEVVEHPNIVKLVGYCAEYNEIGTQRFLVYEYVPNRSVRDHLSTRSNQMRFSWITRLKVARDVARALAYLHNEMELQDTLEDFKSSNILLDDKWNAKLSDLGLVRLGPQRRITQTCRQAGYAQTRYLTSKNDVWSYGVLLCELITGRRPLDRTRPENEQKLLEWVVPYLDSQKFPLIVDPRLEGKYSRESVQKLLTIANMCLNENHASRPLIGDILNKIIQVLST